MKPVTTLRELRNLAGTDPRYKEAAILASCQLGGKEELPLSDHIEWLKIYSMATTEQDVIDRVNQCIPRPAD